MRKSRSSLVLVTIVLLVFASASGGGRPEAENPAGAKEVRFGIAQIVFATPLLIAIEKGFLRDAGLNVRVKTDPPALEELFADKCDLATGADIPIILNSFKSEAEFSHGLCPTCTEKARGELRRFRGGAGEKRA